MTSLGPSTHEPTLLFQDKTLTATTHFIKPGTVLDYLSQHFPYFYTLIQKENGQHYYNNEQTQCTVFVPLQPIDIHPKAVTVNYKINTPLLSQSKELHLPSLSFNTIKVGYENDTIYINDKPIVFGDVVCINGIVHGVDV